MATQQNKIKHYKALQTLCMERMSDIAVIAESAKNSSDLHNQFKARYTHLDIIYSEFENYNQSLIPLLIATDTYNIDEIRDSSTTFYQHYYSAKSIYTQLFETGTNNQIDAVDHRSNVKLPKIELVKFDGNLRQWKTFIGMFNCLVHDNSKLKNIEKFNYLISSLSGAPLALVKRNDLTDANYVIAYNSLIKRYENKRDLATAHYLEIENAPNLLDNTVTPQNLRSLVDIFTENLAALKNLGFPTESWSFLLFNMLLKRLDTNTVSRYELESGSDEIPTFDSLVDFVSKQCSSLDRAADYTQNSSPRSNVKFRNSPIVTSSKFTPRRSSFHTQVRNSSCSLCSGEHLIYKCPQFLALPTRERFNVVKSHKWCVNCLGCMHTIKNCSSQSHCVKCGQSHHTLLHFNDSTLLSTNRPNQGHFTGQSHVGNSSNLNSQGFASPNQVPNSSPSLGAQGSHSSPHTATTHYCALNSTSTILLSTALIEVLDAWGSYQKARALLDTGSQVSIISAKFCNRLGLKNDDISLSIQGISQMNSRASKSVSLQIRPRQSPKPVLKVNAIVLPKVCNRMPSNSISTTSWSYISNLDLADPSFNISGDIDILLGADIFSLVLESGRISGSINEPVAFNTIFGWILMGAVNDPTPPILNSLHCTCAFPLDSAFKRLWEIEEIPKMPIQAPDDERCEKIFQKTVSRNSSGRFVVTLPFKSCEPVFSGSRDIALKRFFSLEKRLRNNLPIYQQYREFMDDYLKQGHMSLLKSPDVPNCSYYIPHHCVLRPDSLSTKLRVVFDASAKSSDGTSLNDTLMTGPKLQRNLVTILLNFRVHPIALMVDIRQMYRQILVSEDHVNYQRILWRFSPDQPIQEFILNTVTYGVSSAPFLAIRVLLQLAEEGSSEFPLASEAIITSSYVDDIVLSCHTIEIAQTLKNQLISLLGKGGFQLHKWNSNQPSLHSDELSTVSKSLDLEQDPIVVKVLGLEWNSSLDVFSFSISSQNLPCTKRNVLSDLARIFDPLGFLTPLTLFAKRLIQHLWTIGLGWDDRPPQDVVSSWNRFKCELPILSQIRVPRYLFHLSENECELHGFSDASIKGYAAVIYCRYLSNNIPRVSLICAKSKVSPLKTVSIPRLELCGAALLSELLSFVENTFKNQITINGIVAWTDSSTTLNWIQSSPHKLQTFVSNRVSFIQERFPPAIWRYVPSKDNPADCASRGMLPSQLVEHLQWWAGPSWLSEHPSSWPSISFKNNLTSEFFKEQKKHVLLVQNETKIYDVLLAKYSSLSKLQRIIAYIRRFIKRSHKTQIRTHGSYISNSELNEALIILVQHVQGQVFHAEIASLLSKTLLCKSLRKLNIFLDNKGLLRVGGRLTYSGLSYDKRHPLLLPSNHVLTELIVESTHKQYLHPGNQTLSFLLLQKFWILSAKRVIRRITSRCLTCWKQSPKCLQPPMGNLPPLRVSQVKPFSCIGVDFGGPFTISLGRFRGIKTHKAYICLFVCFATKALHLELATDLSSDTFLAALRRLVSRRGRVSIIHSDNATNFVGCYRQLLKLMQNAAEQECIEWKFIPPMSPHFGGLWEAGIKSVKSHISRVIGEQILTYEEFNTLLVQVEAVLNSRPLCPASTDPNDISALTPGHFLTLEPLNSFPDEDLLALKINTLSRWQLIQRLHQDFWSRWNKEYLHTLFQRGKWTEAVANIKTGSLVLLKNDNVPPLRWQLGRIIDIHPGKDGIVRVVTVQTSTGSFKRSVTKVCPLPLAENDNQ